MNPVRNPLKACLQIVIVSVLLLMLFASTSNPLVSAETIRPKVGLIPEGPIDDNGYNQMAYEGFLRAVDEELIDGILYLPVWNPEPDYAGAITECVADGNSLCVTVGFMMSDATMEAAENNPSINFAIVDMTWNEADYPANLRGMFFSVDEAAYLAGTLAGLMTATNKIGIVAGMSIPPVNDFVFPYINGAQWANHAAFPLLDYANEFGDENLGATLAQSQIDRGADVVLGVAGITGNGAIKQAASQSKYCIGVDVDTYYTVFEEGAVTGAEYLLTSVMKRVDNAVYDTIVSHVNGTFTSGTYTYNVANDGVGLAPYHETAPDIPLEVITYINNVAAGIANGTVDIWQPFYTAFIYLPILVR